MSLRIAASLSAACLGAVLAGPAAAADADVDSLLPLIEDADEAGDHVVGEEMCRLPATATAA